MPAWLVLDKEGPLKSAALRFLRASMVAGARVMGDIAFLAVELRGTQRARAKSG
jgi:hypothetical protein